MCCCPEVLFTVDIKSPAAVIILRIGFYLTGQLNQPYATWCICKTCGNDAPRIFHLGSVVCDTWYLHGWKSWIKWFTNRSGLWCPGNCHNDLTFFYRDDCRQILR